MRVFVSYKREDEAHNEWVIRFATDLRSNGIDALLDQWEVRYGASFTDYMTSAINNSDVVLFIMTPRSVEAAEAPSGKGGALKFEVQLATARRIAGENLRLIGVLRKGEKVAAHVRDFRYADFRDDGKYYEALISLVNDLLGLGSKPVLGRAMPSETIKEEITDEPKGKPRIDNFEKSATADDVKSFSSEKGGYIYRGFLYALPALLTLLSGYRIQTTHISSRDLLGLSIPICFSPFCYLCYAYRVDKQPLSISALLRREALYTQPLLALLYSIAIFFAAGRGVLSSQLVWPFAIYVFLCFGYGFFLLNVKPHQLLPSRHQLIWLPIFSFAITLYLGLSFSTLQVSAIPLFPVALLIALFCLFEIVPSQSRGSLIFVLFLITVVGVIVEFRANGQGLLSHSLKSMLFCLCIAAYLAVFDAWTFTSAAAVELTSNQPIELSRPESNQAIARVLKFSTATSIALTTIVCLLPFLFVFSEYGIVFLVIFSVHASVSIILWFSYGNDLNRLRSLPWLFMKTVITTIFLGGLFMASTFNAQPVMSVTRGLAGWTGISMLQIVAGFSVFRLIRSTQRIYNKSRSVTANTLLRVFLNKMNLVRLLSLVSLVSVFIVVPLVRTLSTNNLLQTKVDLVFCVYTLFILLGLVLEILHDLTVLPRYRTVQS
jgi:hypothetical protein